MNTHRLVAVLILNILLSTHAYAAKDSSPEFQAPETDPMGLYRKGASGKDLAKEKQRLLQTLSENRGSSDAWRRLAEVLYVEKNYGECLQALENLLKLEPGDPRGNILLGEVFLARKEAKKAVAQFQKLTAMAPESAQARYKLGLSHMLAGDDESAAVELRKAVSLDPELGEAGLALAELKMKSGRTQEAVKDLESLILRKPAFVPAYIALGRVYLSKGDREKAIATFQRVAAAAPKDPRGSYYLGVALKGANQAESAGQQFEKAMALEPGYAEALDQLVLMDMASGNTAQALQRVLRQSKIVPDSVEIQFILGSLYQKMNRPEDAKQAFTKALDINPGYARASVELSRIFMNTGRYPDALGVLEKALQTRPAPDDEQLLMMLMGIAHEQMRDYPAAAKWYEKVVAANPVHALALNNLAYVHLERFRDPETAHGYARRAYEAAPNDPSIIDTLGWTLYRKGDYPGALNLLVQNASRLSDSGEALYHLGMAHYKSGNQAEARVWLEKALDLDPNFSGADEARQVLSKLPAD